MAQNSVSPLRHLLRKLRFYLTINWIKTLYFNFKKFPYEIAKKLPVVFYGPVSLQDISGEIVINGPISMGMIGYGQYFEQQKRSKGIAEIILRGTLIFNGPAHIGKDVFLFIGENARCEFNYMSCLGSDVKLVCTSSITIGEWTGIGYESQIIDTNSHPMIDVETKIAFPVSAPISLGSHNAVSNRVSIMPSTITPDFCVIASNTLCNKDYSVFGSNVLIGGVPAKLLKTSYSRDWENEYEVLKKYKLFPY
ncbi:MAG TPA: transferase [Flavobacterium sp.]|jgi:acetyltransferase-like isoleucine patch superfamily enzyme